MSAVTEGAQWPSADAFAFVLGPPGHDADAEARVCRLGLAWRFGIEAWRELGYGYAVLFAPARNRVTAPKLYIARDLHMLSNALRICCAQLNGITCLWFRMADEAGNGSVDRELLRDVAPMGRA